MYPKGTCSAALHGARIVPREMLQEVCSFIVRADVGIRPYKKKNPSPTALRHGTRRALMRLTSP